MSTTTRIEEERITRSPDEIKETRQQLVVSGRTGLLAPRDLSQALELAQSMAKGECAIPKHLRGSPGACLAVIEYANNWEMAPYAVANKSYVVNDRLCFESQLVHAVIKKRVSLKYPELGLDCTFEGEGPTRVATISAEVVLHDGTSRVLSWPTPMLKDIEPKNSPLWKTNDKQQQFYRGVLLWQRRFYPEILLGVYTKDEIDDMTPEERAAFAEDRGPAQVVTLGRPVPVRSRTVEDGGEGFHPDNVHGIEGKDRPVGPIIDNNELANVAADAPEQQPTQSAPVTSDRQSAGAEPPAAEGTTSTSAPADLFDPAQGTKKVEPQPEAPKGPTNDEEYQLYLREWLVRESDPSQIAERYAGEQKLRTQCKADLKACKALKNARLEVLGAPT